MIAPDVPQDVVNAQTRQYRLGPVFYLASFLVAIVSPLLSVAINLGMAMFFAVPLKVK